MKNTECHESSVFSIVQLISIIYVRWLMPLVFMQSDGGRFSVNTLWQLTRFPGRKAIDSNRVLYFQWM